MMFYNSTGSTKRWIAVLISTDDLLDSDRMKVLHKFLPKDAKAVSVESKMGNQVALMIESNEFMVVSYGGAIPVRVLDALVGK